MKSKCTSPVTVVCLLFLWFAATATAQPVPLPAPAPAAGVPPPATAITIDPNTGLPLPATPPQIDPATGLPPEPEWIPESWEGPNTVLADVSYDGLPLSEVARDLRARFKDGFNILPLPKAFDRDWGSEIVVHMQLKNVKAREIFDAMNLVFENDRTPVRWELRNASVPSGLPFAQLRVLPQAAQWHNPGEAVAPPPVPTQRMVYYVGNLVGDEKTGGLTMDQITKTILDVWPSDFGKPDGVLQFHKDAQLLVVNGTAEEIQFIHQTLAALQEKVDAARPKTEAAKDIDELNSLIKSLKTLGNDSKF